MSMDISIGRDEAMDSPAVLPASILEENGFDPGHADCEAIAPYLQALHHSKVLAGLFRLSSGEGEQEYTAYCLAEIAAHVQSHQFSSPASLAYITRHALEAAAHPGEVQ